MTEIGIPRNHVLAVISGDGAAEATSQDLRRHGFDEIIRFEGNDVAEKVDPKGDSNPFTKILRSLGDHVSEELNYLTQYQEEARKGKSVLAVKVKGTDQVESVRQVLETHGAQNVRYFGALATADLTPESNPTPRSAESPEKWDET
jgi:hypothetical protein